MKLKSFRVLLLALSLAAALFLLFAAVQALGITAWAEFDVEKITGCSRTTILYDGQDRELARLHGVEDRVWVPLDAVGEHTVNALISAEDARFFDHDGIDLIRIAGAVIADIKAGGYVQGASTISQQLIKLSHLTSEKTISRKAEEAVLAYQMEKRYSKEEILEMYLNFVYFGGGYYGIEAAAKGYFGVSARELTLSQSALLAGILKSPSNYAPHLNYEASLQRRDLILTQMKDYGYISQSEMNDAKSEAVMLAERDKGGYSGYYTDAVVTCAAKLLGVSVDEVICGGYSIYSAMDRDMQQLCDSMFANHALFPTDDCQAAMVVQGQDGMVLALNGGRSYQSEMGLNRATDIRRQPGSVIKPIIAYAPAFEYLGYTAATMVLDEETVFGDYAPTNINDEYYGWVTVREAVTRSLNIPAIKILSQVGVNRAKEFASSCGIEFDKQDNSLTLALGGFTYGISPLQAAGAYSCFATGGIYNTPTVIRYILDSNGNRVYEYTPQNTQVMSRENAYIITSMLKSVVSGGTGHRLSALNIPLAGKTGTVGTAAGNRDAWMASYTPDYTAVVWMGYDSDNHGMLPADASGGKYPAMMLSEFYSAIYPDGCGEDFAMPNGVVQCRIDARTLSENHEVVLCNALTPEDSQVIEYFTLETAPQRTTSYWSVPVAAKNLSATTDRNGVKVSFSCPDTFGIYMLYRRERGKAEELIGEFGGNMGSVEYIDKDVVSGNTYEYRVLVKHAELKIGLRTVFGPTTRYVSAKAGGRMLNIKVAE